MYKKGRDNMNLDSPLKEGSTGNEVTILQQKLKILGYYTPTVTGSFGPDTTLAVRTFQEENGLLVTGIVNTETWNTIFALTPSPFPTKRVLRPVLKRGSTGEDVKTLQRNLTQLMFYDGAIDGKFGVETENAVKAFQANNRLTADGIVGPDTWSALTYLYAPLAICGNESKPPTPPADNGNYVVKQGDTLYSIAKKNNTTVDAIKSANGLTNNIISVGQKLIIPKDSTEPNYVDYVVQKGDTLYAIANRYDITVNDIMKLNNLNSTTISIGQELKIPNTNVTIYTVKKGDTLYSIAKANNTTVTSIKQLNNLTSDTLSIGQQLKIR